MNETPQTPEKEELSSISNLLIKLFGKKQKPNTTESGTTLDGEKQASALTKAYISAFLLIAVATLMVHIVTTSITNIQQQSIRNSFHINQERILVEQISSSMLKHYDLGENLDYDFLSQAINKLEANHKVILASISDNRFLAYNSPVLRRVFFEDEFAMAQNINNFIEKARTYTSYEAADTALERKESYDFVQENARALLQPILNQALTDYQNEVISSIQFYHNLQSIGVVAIFVILILEALFIFRPLASHLRQYHTMLLKQALEDPLTKLNNRRAFMARSDAAIASAIRDNKSLIVALCDLDHFKSVNDTYGHDIGDRVLKHFSFVLKKSVRRGDFIGRIGGEEFALLLPNTDYETGKEVLNRLCKTVADTPCPLIAEKGTRENLNYTVSIGFTTFTAEKTSANIDTLLKHADEALYTAKEQGRNRIAHKLPE